MSDRVVPPTPPTAGPTAPGVTTFIHHNAPFGPVASEDLGNGRLRNELFDKENRVYSRLVRRDPAFVIGRRGAGKTSFLHALTTDRPTLDVTVDTSTAIAEIEELREALEEYRVKILTDHVSKIWAAALWHHVLLRLVKKRPEGVHVDDQRFDAIRVYLHDLADRDPVYITEDEILGLFCEYFLEQAMERRTLARNPLALRIGDVTLAEIVELADEVLTEAELQAVLLMDSIEDFKRVLDQHADAIGGLFNCVGRSAQPLAPYRIRFSFPAELWNVLNTMSENPLKDFGSFIVLHWSAREIVKIAAHRYMLYLRHFHEPFLQRNKPVARLSIDNERDAIKLLRAVLPERVTGELGIEEDTIAYVLRHTQLLPRHLLRILNAIWLREGAPEGSTQVSQEAVVLGIRDVEEQIVTEICKAYELVHPVANDVCRAVIKNLPRRFSDSELHRTFNQVGKGALKRAHQRLEQRQLAAPVRRYGTYGSPGPDMDYHDFKAMLIEIGCLGRLREQTERYDVADFDYTVSVRLSLGDDDIICVHPLFSGVYQSRTQPDQDHRVVYPYGTDPLVDHRAFDRELDRAPDRQSRGNTVR
ncbi:MAG: hypothetical protein AAGD35_03245 [Actinomycetota bacterium]